MRYVADRAQLASLLTALGRRDAAHRLRVADVLDIGCDHSSLRRCECGPRGPLTDAERRRVTAPTPARGQPNPRAGVQSNVRGDPAVIARLLGWTVEDVRDELTKAVRS